MFCRHCGTSVNETDFNKTTSRCKTCESKRKEKYRTTDKDLTIIEKSCSTCKETKPLKDFHNDRRTVTGKASVCKECASRRMKEWYWSSEDRKQRIRDGGLKFKYGISREDYFRMLDDQEGVCAICEGNNEGRYLHVDHDHNTNEIRGLLCRHCNHGLGNFKDNPRFLTKACDYLSYKET